MMKLPSDLFILLSVIHVHKAEYLKEVTVPVSSPVRLDCDGDLRVNNIEVKIRRRNTTCMTTLEDCTLPIQAIETIKNTCNKQVACEVDIRNITNNYSCLQEFGYFNLWYTCKTIIDYSCDFESNLCNWLSVRDKNRYRWRRGLRGDNKPPYVDHTSSSSIGHYVYIHSFEPSSAENDNAKLESGDIVATENQCFSFWYYTTNSRDSVRVYQDQEHLLNLSYNSHEEIKWRHIQIPLVKKSPNSFQLIFSVTQGNYYDGFFGAIVIDDILIENRNCASDIIICDFDSYPCGWNDDSSDQNIWNKRNGEPQQPHTGPLTDHSTASNSGFYVYLRGNLNTETTAYFEMYNFKIKFSENSCLTFWYHMNFDMSYGAEGLTVTTSDEVVWSKFENMGNKWIKAAITLHINKTSNIKFTGFLGSYIENDIAIDDISLKQGTCEGLVNHEEICVGLDDYKETHCPKAYLDFTALRLSFDPEKDDCSDQYELTRTRLIQECEDRDDSQKCFIVLTTDIHNQPECFQLYEIQIQHTCEAEITTIVSEIATSTRSSIADKETTTVPNIDISTESSSAVSDKSVSLPTVLKTSSESSTGLVVGLVIGGLLLACVVILIVIIVRRQTFGSGPTAKVRNNLHENDYIGCQDIALPQAADHSGLMQCTDKQTLNDDEYAIINPSAETSFNEIIGEVNPTSDSYMILDPTQTGFNRQLYSNTPVGYEFSNPVKDTERSNGDEDQYAISDGVYDHSGNNRHKEPEVNIYNHAIDTIYDSGSHKRNDEGREDTYDHCIGLKTEDDYDISTTT